MLELCSKFIENVWIFNLSTATCKWVVNYSMNFIFPLKIQFIYILLEKNITITKNLDLGCLPSSSSFSFWYFRFLNGGGRFFWDEQFYFVTFFHISHSLAGKWISWFFKKTFLMDKTRTVGQKWLANELNFHFFTLKKCTKGQSNRSVLSKVSVLINYKSTDTQRDTFAKIIFSGSEGLKT